MDSMKIFTRARPARVAQPPPQTSPFLVKLPGEIRNQIYSLVFEGLENKVTLHLVRPEYLLAQNSWNDIDSTGPSKHLGLLHVCRQTRAEAFGFTDGVVQARLVACIRSSGAWHEARLSRAGFEKEINKSFSTLGSVYLNNVRDLQIGDVIAAWRVIDGKIYRPPNKLRTTIQRLLGRGDPWKGDTLTAVRKALCNVERITFVENSEDFMPSVKQIELVSSFVSGPKTREEFRKSFPNLKSVRFTWGDESDGLGMSIDNCGVWYLDSLRGRPPIRMDDVDE